MKSAEEEFYDQAHGCCCGIYFMGFVAAVVFIFSWLIPAVGRLL